MKKVLALVMAMLLVLSAIPALAEGEGVERLIVLNNAFEGLEVSSQRYNAYWLDCWNFGQFAEDNFWFIPADDDQVSVVAYTDYYTDSADTFATMSEKYISLMYDDLYDVVCGPTQKMTTAVQYMGYITVGYEAVLFMQEDGWDVSELFEDIGMAKADAYEFIAADGYTVKVAADKIDQCFIEFVDERVDGVLPGLGSYTLFDIRYIVPAGTKEGSEPVEGINKITVFVNAEGVYDTEAPEVTNFGGTLYDAYSVAELLAKHEVTPCETVKTIAYTDGYTMNDSYELFAQKYIAMTSPKATHPFTLGQVQPRNAGVQNAGYYILSEDAFFFLPEGSENVAVADIFAKIGMVEADAYLFTCADGYTHEVKAEKLDECFIGFVDGRVDGITPGLGGFTLYDILYVTPVAE